MVHELPTGILDITTITRERFKQEVGSSLQHKKKLPILFNTGTKGKEEQTHKRETKTLIHYPNR